ncbi:unnamed protein product [Mytilus coruscus]|uniref:MAM domain-containing protein n=1 Tax=Mytilus coruscus TaxID=42192 RepID=A0A6J8C206_MYTCO|nr:unnamed protein product [Mytilus coruscus]
MDIFSDRKEVTIPVSSPIQLECDNDLKVNNVEVTIRRSNTTCLTTTPECTLPNDAIAIIKETCNKQETCEVDIPNFTNNQSCLHEYGYLNVWYTCKIFIDEDFSLNELRLIIVEDELKVPEYFNVVTKKGRIISRKQEKRLKVTSVSDSEKIKVVATLDYHYRGGEQSNSTKGIKVIPQTVTCTSRIREQIVTRYSRLREQSVTCTSRVREQRVTSTSRVRERPVTRTSRVREQSVTCTSRVRERPVTRTSRVPIIDFSCDFESNLCNWSLVPNNYGFRWRRGYRWSSQIPYGDHTSASNTGKYVYIYSPDYGSFGGDIAKLESGHIIATEQQCFSFWFYTTNSRDSVHVFQNEDSLLNLTYNYEEQIWNHIQIPLGKKSHDSFKLVFKVIRGNPEDGSYGAIVIDDILIENQRCDSYILNCDFETNPCDWKTDESNQYVWRKQHGQPTFDNTGPITDHSTASGSRPDLNGDEIRTSYLEFQNVDLHVPGNFCLTFWYHMYHYQNRMEKLSVKLDDEIVWTEFGKRNNKWKKGAIDLHKTKNINIKFIGILSSYWWNNNDIAIDDIFLTEGTCKGLSYHEETCVHLENRIPKETFCPKGYLLIQNQDFSFDPKGRNVLAYMIRLRHVLWKTVKTVLIHKNVSLIAVDTTTASSFITLSEGLSAGLVVGLGIGGLLLTFIVIVFAIFLRRRTFVSGPKEKRRNNLQENDYIGSQDIALPQTDSSFGHIQNDFSRKTSVHGYDSTNTNAKINNVNKERVQAPAYAVRQKTTLSNNQTLNDNEYSIVDQTAETSFTRTKLFQTPTGNEFPKPVRDTENKIGDEDQYDISEEGVYDHSGSNRHKELEDNIYNHAIDTIYDSGSHKRKHEGREDTYDHFFGQKTEDDYDISTTI